jgi:hypothetical protein
MDEADGLGGSKAQVSQIRDTLAVLIISLLLTRSSHSFFLPLGYSMLARSSLIIIIRVLLGSM